MVSCSRSICARLFFGMAGPYAASSHLQFQPLLKWALSHCAVSQSIQELRFPTLCRTFCKLFYSLLNLLSSCNSHICRVVEEHNLYFAYNQEGTTSHFLQFSLIRVYVPRVCAYLDLHPATRDERAILQHWYRSRHPKIECDNHFHFRGSTWVKYLFVSTTNLTCYHPPQHTLFCNRISC